MKEFSSKNGYDLNRNGDSGPLLLDVLEGFLKFEVSWILTETFECLNYKIEIFMVYIFHIIISYQKKKKKLLLPTTLRVYFPSALDSQMFALGTYLLHLFVQKIRTYLKQGFPEGE